MATFEIGHSERGFRCFSLRAVKLFDRGDKAIAVTGKGFNEAQDYPKNRSGLRATS